MPVVSVVMPVFNARPFIAQTLESICNQSFADWELILIDDGSTDGTNEILARYRQADARIQVVRTENRGQVNACALGVSMARGEFIARHDHDDLSEPERFALQIEALRANPDLVALGTGCLLIDSAGDVRGRQKVETSPQRIRKQLAYENPMKNPTVMLRKWAWDKVGGERACFGHAHDYDLWLRMVEIGDLGNIDQPLLRYRVHDGQASYVYSASQAICLLAIRLSTERRRANQPGPFEGRTRPVSRDDLLANGFSDRAIDEAVLDRMYGRIIFALQAGCMTLVASALQELEKMQVCAEAEGARQARIWMAAMRIEVAQSSSRWRVARSLALLVRSPRVAAAVAGYVVRGLKR